MKKRLSYFQLSKTVMFALILFMVGLYVWGAGKITVCAADYTSLDTTTNENFVVAAYTADVAKKYVGTKAPTVENYLFAGWFKDAKCSEEQVIISATEIVDGTTCYAKFVPEDVLSIKVQISEGDANSSTADVEKNIRFVSSVDTVTYTSIGFRMKYQDDNQNWVYKISRGTLVYKRIETATKGDEYRFSPKVVDTKSEYFMTSVWKGENNAGIVQEDYDTNYYVRAYWVTFDGIRVYGPTRYVSVNDGLNSNIVNTSIKDTKQTLSGKTLSASYTNSTGKEATASSVELYHDGTYAHLKIDLGTSVNRTTALLSATKFTVTGGTATADAIYRNLYTTHKTTTTTANADSSWYTVYNAADSTEKEYVVATSADLYGFAELGRYNASDYVTFEGKTVYFCSDITVNDGTSEEVKANSNAYKWYAISKFAGTVDGQDHVISGLYATCDWDGTNKTNEHFAPGVGLFTNTSNAIFRNFNIKNGYYAVNYDNGGAVVAAGSGTLENIYTDVIMDSGSHGRTGGILGQATGKVAITNCWSDSDITSSGVYFGGILGNAQGNDVSINHCLNTGDLTFGGTGNAVLGGIVGRGDASGVTLTINDCLNSGTVAGTTSNGKMGTILGTAAATNADTSTSVTITNTYSIYNYKTDGTTLLPEVGNNLGANMKRTASISSSNLSGTKAFDNTGLTFGDGTTGAYWMVHRTSTPILAYFLEDAGSVYSIGEVEKDYFTIVDGTGYISNLGELISFRRRQNSGELNEAYPEGFKAILTADIEVNANADATKWASGAVATPAESWEQIVNFKGTFEGQNHTISGISCTEDPYREGTGFFAMTDGATIKNLSIENSYFYASTNSGTGALVSRGTGTFTNIYSDVEFGAPDADTGRKMGGIMGMATGVVTLSNCWNASDYENFPGYEIGGILGGISSDVNTNSNLIIIKHCLNTGNLISSTTKTNAFVGGIVGMGNASSAGGNGELSVSDCLNTGIVNGTTTTKYMGAIVANGPNNSTYSGNVRVTNCHSAIRYDSAGTVIGKTNTLVGAYPANTKTNANSKAIALGEVTDVHATHSTALDFANGNWVVRKADTPILAKFASKSNSVRDSWFKMTDGAGSIANADDLETFALEMNGGCITTDSNTLISMTSDIDLNEGWTATANATAPSNIWTPIVGFAGNFSGNGYTIRGAYVKAGSGNGVGLFTETNAASIQNLRIENSYYLIESTKGAGAIIGQGSGIIKDVYADVIFKESGTDIGRIGGIVGIATGETMMNNCWSASDITTNYAYCGGILGNVNNTGYRITLLHCLNTGDITTTKASGNAYVGGLVGRANNTHSTSNPVTAGVLEIRDSINAGIVKGTKISSHMAGLAGYVVPGGTRIIETTGIEVPTYLTIIKDSYTIKRYDSSGTAIATTSAIAGGPYAETDKIKTTNSKAIELADIKGNAATTNTSLNFDSYWAVRANDLPQLMHFSLAVGDYDMPRYDTEGLVTVHSLGNDEYELCIQNSSKAELLAYAEVLKQQGYVLDRTNIISSGTINQAKYGEDNEFYTYVNSERHMYLSWNPGMQIARVIMTNVEVLPSLDVPKVTSADNTVASVAQMQLDGPGMGYIIQLVDGSFICIDGGYYDYTQNGYPGDPFKSDRVRMYEYMCEKSPHNKPQIACWVLTHADPDHLGAIPFFLEDYAGKVDIHSFAYNFPEEDYKSANQGDDTIIENLVDFDSKVLRYFPNAEKYNVHAGQTFYFKGMEMEILQTEEEFVPCKVATWNDSSLTMRMKFSGGQVALFLTDNMQVLNQQLEETYTDYAKCDILQLAHHGLIGGDLELYKYAHPSICYWPTTEARFNGTDPDYNYAYCKGQGKCDYNAYLHPEPDATVLEKIGGGIGSTLTHYHNGHMGVVKLPSNGKIEAVTAYQYK